MTALAARMLELDATDAGVGKLIGRGAEQVESWRKGESEIDAEGRVLLRTFLADDPHAARLAIEKLRNTYTRDMRGEGMEYAGLDPADIADNTPPLLDGGLPT